MRTGVKGRKAVGSTNGEHHPLQAAVSLDDKYETLEGASVIGQWVEIDKTYTCAAAYLSIGIQSWVTYGVGSKGPLKKGVNIPRRMSSNGVAVEMNRDAFRWGRRAAHDLDAVERLAMQGDEGLEPAAPATLDEFIKRRVGDVTSYQNAAWASR